MASAWFGADGDAGPPQAPDSVEASAARQRASVGGRRVAERLGMTVLCVRIGPPLPGGGVASAGRQPSYLAHLFDPLLLGIGHRPDEREIGGRRVGLDLRQLHSVSFFLAYRRDAATALQLLLRDERYLSHSRR